MLLPRPVQNEQHIILVLHFGQDALCWRGVA